MRMQINHDKPVFSMLTSKYLSFMQSNRDIVAAFLFSFFIEVELNEDDQTLAKVCIACILVNG